MSETSIQRVRRYRDRCAHCGHRFHWKRDARFSYGNRDGKVWHGPCLAHEQWRVKADERLAILDLVCDVWNVNERDAKVMVELRAKDDDERRAASNRAFRVFYDLEEKRAAEVSP